MELNNKTKLKVERWKSSSWVFKISTLYLLSFSTPIVAQVVPDNTLTNNSRVTNQGSINTISEGTRAGSNLFHSFEQFSLPTGGTAYFNNPVDIQNIISRVTGKSTSNIDGLIQANGAVDFFLLNPNGILFGPNARLNIGGSFVATTANSIKFADGKQFLVQPNQKEPLLTITAPIGLGFKDNSTGIIQVLGRGHQITPNTGVFPTVINNDSIGLSVQTGKTLALIGSNVNVEGGIITAPGGRSELGSVGSGSVSLKPNSQGWTFGYEEVSKFENIQLSKQALVNASGTGAGTIQVHGGDVHLTDGSAMLIQNLGETSSGILNINAFKSLILEGTSPDGKISSTILTETLNTGEGGDLRVSAQNLTLQDGARMGTSTYSNAPGGKLTVNASNSVQLLKNRFANPFRRGDTISFIGAGAFSEGNAGSVWLSTNRLLITDGGTVASSTRGAGNGTNITVDANFIEIIGIKPERLAPSTIAASTFGAGDSGNLTINTFQLRLKDGGVVNAASLATGNAGNLSINARDFIEVSGKAVNSQPSFISSSVTAANETVRRIFGLPSVPSGSSGNINIDTKLLNVNQGGRISVGNEGVGNAGILQITANTINVTNDGSIAATTAIGQGGNIDLYSNILLLNNGNISATAGQQGTNGDGGNINIDTDVLFSLGSSSITANAFGGRGGNILINADAYFFSRKSRVEVSSQFGISGRFEINGLSLESRSIKPTPEVVRAIPEIVSACQGRSGVAASELVISGRGGFAPSSEEMPYAIFERQNNSISIKNNDLGEPKPTTVALSPEIVEANGWKIDSNGRLVLTAEADTATPIASSLSASACRQERYTSEISLPIKTVHNDD